MTIEIDPYVRLQTLRWWTRVALEALAEAGHQPLLRGPWALAQRLDLEPAPQWPLVLEVEGDPRRARELLDRTDLPKLGAAIEVFRAGRTPPKLPPSAALQVAVDAALTPVAGAEAIAALEDGAPLQLTGTTAAAWLRGRADRIFELAALVAATGQHPEPEVLRLCERAGGHVLSLDREVWLAGLDRVLCSPRARLGLELLEQVRVLPLLLPEVAAMIDFHQSCAVHHKDIWDHTLQVVEKSPPLPIVRWAALMHDVGKVWTRTVGPRGRVQFLRHEELGAILMEGVAARLHMPAAQRDAVCYVIGNHARANVYATSWTDAAVRRLMRDMGEHLDHVVAFSRSDFTTKRAAKVREVLALGDELLRRMAEVRAADARVPPLPKGLGNLLMQRTGRAPGPWIGAIQRRLEAEVEAGGLAPGLDAEAYHAWLQRHAPELLAAPQG